MLHHINRVNTHLSYEDYPGRVWGDPDGCDGCGDRDELYHSEVTGLALCDACDQLAEQDASLFSDDADVREAARQRYVIEFWLTPLALPHDWSVKA